MGEGSWVYFYAPSVIIQSHGQGLKAAVAGCRRFVGSI